MSITKIQHIELSSAQSSITFSSIPQTFTDLLLVTSARKNNVSPQVTMRFNGSTSGYSARGFLGITEQSSIFTYTDTTILGGLTARSTSTANTFSNNAVYISNYTSSNAKSTSLDAVHENNAAAANQWFEAGLWNNSAAITEIQLLVGSDSFTAGTSATLYGVTKGSTAGVTVT
jgi:hypothetical protein